MTQPDDSLSADAQRLIDQICNRFNQNPHTGLDAVADLIAQAPDDLQSAAAEVLLERHFARLLKSDETIDEREAVNQLGLGDDLVHRAKQAAMAELSNPEKLQKLSLPKLLIDRYELDRPIGAGGFGEVGRYLDRKNHGRPVAIKLSRPDRDGFGEHLLDEEAQSLIQAEGHSGVVTLLDHLLVDPDGKEPTNGARSRHALVMQFIEGDTLEKNRLALMQLSAEERRDKAVAWTTRIGDATGFLHRKKVVHRDLKPANVLMDSNGDLRVTDFGLAWNRVAGGGSLARPAGTAEFFSPQIADAWLNGQEYKPRKQDDVYALGVMFFLFLTGKLPYPRMGTDEAARNELLNRIANGDRKRITLSQAGVGSALIDLIDACLATDPNNRPATGDDFVMQLKGKFRVTIPGRPEPLKANFEVNLGGAGHGGSPPSDHGHGPSGDSGSGSGNSRSGRGFDRRAAELFVGREDLLGWLDGIFGELDSSGPHLKPDDPALVAYLHAMPGLGKTYLIDRWFWLRRQRAKVAGQRDGSFFVVDLPLNRSREYSADSLRDELAAKLKLNGTDIDGLLRATLSGGFLRIENVDSEKFGHAVTGLAAKLDGCRLIVSARWYAQGTVPKRWRERAVSQLTPEQAAQQFVAEVGDDFWTGLSDGQRESLVTRTGRLPLAIHLASTFLLKPMSVDRLLDLLPQLTLQDAEDPRFGQSVLKVMVDELLKSLDQTLRSQPWLKADELLAGFRRLGFAHPAGVGRSLAAAMSGLSEEDLADLLVEAPTLHLIEREELSDRFRLHPLIAEQLTLNVDRSSVDEAVTEWFVKHLLKEEGFEASDTWHNVDKERAALINCLSSLPNDPEILSSSFAHFES